MRLADQPSPPRPGQQSFQAISSCNLAVELGLQQARLLLGFGSPDPILGSQNLIAVSTE